MLPVRPSEQRRRCAHRSWCAANPGHRDNGQQLIGHSGMASTTPVRESGQPPSATTVRPVTVSWRGAVVADSRPRPREKPTGGNGSRTTPERRKGTPLRIKSGRLATSLGATGSDVLSVRAHRRASLNHHRGQPPGHDRHRLGLRPLAGPHPGLGSASPLRGHDRPAPVGKAQRA